MTTPFDDDGDDGDEERQRMAAAVFRARLAEAFRRRPRATWALVALLVAVGALQGLAPQWLGPHGAERLLLAGALIPDRVEQGEWWRLLTGTLLHKDWAHWLLNAVGIGLVGRHVEAAFGGAGLILLWLLAALAGAAGTMWGEHGMSVGASGQVFGLVGALVAIGLRLWGAVGPRLHVALVAVPALAVASLLLLSTWAAAVAPLRIDHDAHVAGVCGGLLAALLLPLRLRDGDGAPLTPPPPRWRKRLVQLAALGGVLLTLAALGTMWRQTDRPAPVVTVELRPVPTRLGTLHLPAVERFGTWRDMRCDNGRAGVDWTLAHDHTWCARLPMGAVLLLGRRDRLLTMDAGDIVAMRVAIAEQRWRRRQTGVALYPVGADHLLLILARDTLLEPLGAALAAMLPVEATVTDDSVGPGAKRPIDAPSDVPVPATPGTSGAR